MEKCLHTHFVSNSDLRSSCDFIPEHFEQQMYVYEVVRIIEGRPLFFMEHYQRLNNSCSLSGYEAPSYKSLKSKLRALIESNQVADGNVKIIVAPKTDEIRYHQAMWFIPHFYPDAAMYRDGVEVAVAELKRATPAIKQIAGNFRQVANKMMQTEKVFEVLMTTEGVVTEGSRSNVFFISGSTIYTAPDTLVLSGITREKVLEGCKRLGIECQMSRVKVDDLRFMDAAFLCGTSPGLLAINSIKGGMKYQTKHHIIQKLSDDYEQQRNNDLACFQW